MPKWDGTGTADIGGRLQTRRVDGADWRTCDAGISRTARGCNGVDPAVAEQMGHKAIRRKDFCEGGVADAEAASVSAEGGHHGADPVTGEAAALHRTAARGDARLGMQMAGDLAARAARLVAEGDRSDRDFVC